MVFRLRLSQITLFLQLLEVVAKLLHDLLYRPDIHSVCIGLVVDDEKVDVPLFFGMQ